MPYFMYTRVVGNVYYNTCTRSIKREPGDKQRTVVWLILSNVRVVDACKPARVMPDALSIHARTSGNT